MLESEWDYSNDVVPMLKSLRLKGANDRKLRLFAVACCRHLLRRVPMGTNDILRVELAERYADGEATDSELITGRFPYTHTTRAQRTAAIACRNATEMGDLIVMADCTAGNAVWAVGEHAASMVNAATNSSVFIDAHAAEQAAQASILRDIIGPLPFRPLPSMVDLLRTPAASNLIALAKSIYDGQTFAPEHMLAVAESLRDVHCENDEMISHCQNTDQIHVRGCWVIDLILSKDR
jgi:hypothetical protein